jgi:hypothetical protein
VDPILQNLQQLWQTLGAARRFYARPGGIELTGYMPTFDELLTGSLFVQSPLRNHAGLSGGYLFEHLYDGAGLSGQNKAGESECPGYCQNKTDFSPCPVKCNCAFVREILAYP